MGREAVSIGANCFQFFTRNPRGGSAKPLNMEDIKRYLEYASENGIQNILAHSSYTLNPCAKDEGLRDYACATMDDDLARLENLPGSMYNFHPGSHVGQGSEAGIAFTADMLNRLTKKGYSTTILIETMAGKGSEIGRSFEEIRAIIDGVEDSRNIGVCMDTCHIFDGGYDIVNDLDGVLNEFDRIIGLDRLKAMHLNDSVNGLDTHKDRHAKIGEGHIGLETFGRIINHASLRALPFFLETPNELDGYAREIELLKSIREE